MNSNDWFVTDVLDNPFLFATLHIWQSGKLLNQTLPVTPLHLWVSSCKIEYDIYWEIFTTYVFFQIDSLFYTLKTVFSGLEGNTSNSWI